MSNWRFPDGKLPAAPDAASLLTPEDVADILDAVVAPETPFVGDDEWDLNDAFKDGWNAALDAVAAKLKAGS